MSPITTYTRGHIYFGKRKLGEVSQIEMSYIPVLTNVTKRNPFSGFSGFDSQAILEATLSQIDNIELLEFVEFTHGFVTVRLKSSGTTVTLKGRLTKRNNKNITVLSE
jgi:hypothetical protein